MLFSRAAMTARIFSSALPDSIVSIVASSPSRVALDMVPRMRRAACSCSTSASCSPVRILSSAAPSIALSMPPKMPSCAALPRASPSESTRSRLAGSTLIGEPAGASSSTTSRPPASGPERMRPRRPLSSGRVCSPLRVTAVPAGNAASAAFLPPSAMCRRNTRALDGLDGPVRSGHLPSATSSGVRPRLLHALGHAPCSSSSCTASALAMDEPAASCSMVKPSAKSALRRSTGWYEVPRFFLSSRSSMCTSLRTAHVDAIVMITSVCRCVRFAAGTFIAATASSGSWSWGRRSTLWPDRRPPLALGESLGAWSSRSKISWWPFSTATALASWPQQGMSTRAPRRMSRRTASIWPSTVAMNSGDPPPAGRFGSDASTSMSAAGWAAIASMMAALHGFIAA
mmetsp:Transcript_21889/g.51872  ORF Transcript_21889/g.51872 Transcript_21889/m.51872 type:complete len:400 (-) Transcript_21889:484-1683(-)